MPGFTFTSLQVVLTGRVELHTDSNNVPPSATISIGPFQGGQICVYDPDDGTNRIMPAHGWISFDGRNPHFVLPHCGERHSIVALTHVSVFSPQVKQLGDSLTRQGFTLPALYGSTPVYPTISGAREEALHKAAMAYERGCDEIMHRATSTTLGRQSQAGLPFAIIVRGAALRGL